MKVEEAITTAWRTAAAHQYVFNPTDFLTSLRANGWVVVPREPTNAMLRVSGIHDDIMSDIYAAMIDAAKENDDGR